MSIDPYDYFLKPSCISQKKYEALRAFFFEKQSAEAVAGKFGYKLSAFYALTRDFRKLLKKADIHEDMFFQKSRPGRKEKDKEGDITGLIVNLRKKYLSVPDIKAIIDSQGYKTSERYIHNVLRKEGFARLPRRSNRARKIHDTQKIKAPESIPLLYLSEKFSTVNSIGILCLIPYIRIFGIDKAIEESQYPETKNLDKLASILSFIGLKLANVRRYSADDIWCMDRGLGLFAGLNVLPKCAWFSSYSSRITRQMNLSFLRSLHGIWKENGLLSDTINLDFTAIPYWGHSQYCSAYILLHAAKQDYSRGDTSKRQPILLQFDNKT